jgi:mevalonate kinase
MISGGNFSFLSTTVNQQKTGAPELEEEIVTRVASYGKQLGRLMEAVDVLAQRAKIDFKGDDRKKLEELTDLADKISVARERFVQDNLDQILSSIGKFGRVGRVDHAALGEIKHLADRLDKR